MRLKSRLTPLLNRLERLLKVDIRHLLYGNLWLNINRATSVANGLILSVAFAHFLTREAYGTYAFALALLGLFSMPQTTALGAGMTKSVARGEDGAVLEGLRRIFPYSVAGAVLLGLVGLYYLYMGNITLAVTFLVGALALPLSVTNSSAKSVFGAKGNFGPLARFNAVRTPIMTATLVAVAWTTHSPLWILVANTLGGLVMSTFLYLEMRRLYKLNTISRHSGTFDARYALHGGILSMLSYLSDQLNGLLLWKFLGAAPVAIYTYAIAPVRELRALLENQSLIAISKFAQKDFSEVRANLLFRIRQMYIVAVPLTLIYVAAAPWIFHILFPQYHDAVLLSQVAALSLLSAPRRLISSAITAHQRIKDSYIMSITPSLARIVLAFALIPRWGIWGAVYALLLAEVAEYVALGILMKSYKSSNT